MGWRFQELKDEEKQKIGFPLPADWEYGGEPGDKIWPIFTCPICKEECESEWGGCSHLMFIYRGSGTDGFYDYLDAKFAIIIKNIVVNKFPDSNLDWNEDDFPSIHSSFLELDDQDIGLEELLPEIQLVEFNGSSSFYDFVDYAGFFKIEE